MNVIALRKLQVHIHLIRMLDFFLITLNHCFRLESDTVGSTLNLMKKQVWL
jgi:hypothetical protein